MALAVLAVALLPVARTLAAGIERAGRASRLRAASETAREVARRPEPAAGAGWTRAGTTDRGIPCWARAVGSSAPDVAWTWIEAVCRREAPGDAPGDDPAARPVRILLGGPVEEGG